MSLFPFAKRTQWSIENNPLSTAIEQMQAKGAPVLDLTESNPTKCGFAYPHEWLKQLSSPQALNYLPEAKGMLSAREAVCDYYAKRQLVLQPEQIVLTSSTSEGYSFLLKLLTNTDDHVLIPRPSYPLFQFLLELHDVKFDGYPLEYVNGAWRIDREEFKRLVTSRTKAVILVHPNNPTCSYVGSSDMAFLNEQCVKHQMAIISDEVFLDYQLTDQAHIGSLLNNTAALTFVLSGISKILGMPQMKLSWIAANGPSATVKQAMDRLEIIADTYLSVNTPVQNALSVWLRGADEIQAQILERVKRNLERLKAKDFNVLSVEGGWYAVIDAPEVISEDDFVLDLLETEFVLIHPGYFFDFGREGYLVISLLPTPEIFDEAIERISRKIQIL